MSDLRELYQQVIIDHSRSPRNYGKLEGATLKGVGYNPLCGDKLLVYVSVEDGMVRDVKFEGSGCAISMASASLMTQFLKGKPADQVEVLFHQFQGMCTGESNGSGPDLGKLEVLAGVREFPARVKCATLAWHTVNKAVAGDGSVAVTE